MTRRALALAASLLLWPLLGHAQDESGREVPAAVPAPVAPPVTVDVRGADAVDPEALRAQLERDLGVHVEIVRGDDARVIVDVTPEGLVRLRVRRDDDRPELSRETPVRPDRAQTVVAVSLLVSNLVRDESVEVLALLRIGAEPEPVAEEPEPPAPPPPALAPPPVEAPAPIAEEPKPPAPEPPAAELPRPEARHVPFGIDFAPGLGFSSAYLGRERRAFSIGVVGALSGGIDGWSGSGVLDVALGSVHGGQMAGVLALATGELSGVQASGVLSVASGVAGLQLAGLASISTGPLSGVQVSVLNIVAGRASGVQLGVMNIAAGRVRGAQLGVTNIAAGDVDGAQIGLVNIASGRVSGLQLGLVNISERADAAIGLVSVHTRGRTHLRLGGDTNGFLGAQVVHGGGATHSILSVAVEPFLDAPTVALGIGFGVRAEPSELLHLDVEILGHVLVDETVGQRRPDALLEARVLAGVEPAEGIAIYLGLAYRAHMTVDASPELGSPFLEHVFLDGGSILVRGWPVLLAGVELF